MGLLRRPSVGIGSNRAGVIGTGGPTPPPAPEPIGDFYNKTPGDNIGDWTITNPTGGVSFTPSGTDLILSGAAGGNLFQDYMVLGSVISCVEKWKMRIRFTTGTINGTSYGFSLGWRSQSGNELIDTVLRPVQDTAFLGRCSVYMGNTVTSGLSTQRVIVPATQYTMTSATTYEVEITRDVFRISYDLYAADGVTLRKSGFYDPPIGSATRFFHNTGSPIIFQHGGTSTLHSIQLTKTGNKNLTSALFGDSIAYGAWATNAANRYMNEFMANGAGSFEVCGGPADTSADLYARRAEIVEHNAQNIFIAVLSNDIAFGISSGTWQTNMNNLRSYLLANTTANIIWMIPVARNSHSMAPAETFLLGWTLAAREKVYNTYQLTKQGGGSGILGAYNYGDGIHPNDAGHQAIGDDLFIEYPDEAG